MNPRLRPCPVRVAAALLGAALPVLSPAAPGQQPSNIDPAHPRSWAENAGWMDWQGAGQGGSGAVVGLHALSGLVWCENVGWLNLGDGTPANGSSYGNADGADAGVNYNLQTNRLSGLGWAENAGWVRFDTALPSASQASFDPTTDRFAGFAWSENLGWIRLGDKGVDLRVVDPADDLGFGKPGKAGVVPELLYYGLLSSGSTHVIALRKALPNALGGLYVSLSSNPTPFKGGVFVPIPVLLFVPIALDNAGIFALTASSGTGSVPVDLILQCTVLDPDAVKGLALSNAVAAHFQP